MDNRCHGYVEAGAASNVFASPSLVLNSGRRMTVLLKLPPSFHMQEESIEDFRRLVEAEDTYTEGDVEGSVAWDTEEVEEKLTLLFLRRRLGFPSRFLRLCFRFPDPSLGGRAALFSCRRGLRKA